MDYDIMTQTIEISDLLRLKKSIEEYVDSVCAAEECFFSDDPETEYVQQRVVNYGLKLKSRIRNAAIDFGINRDFLAEYEALKDLSIDPIAPDLDPFFEIAA